MLHHKSKSQQNVLYIIKMYGDIFDWLREYLFLALSFSFTEETFCIKNMVFVSFAQTRPESLQRLGIVSTQRLIIKHFDNQTRKLYFKIISIYDIEISYFCTTLKRNDSVCLLIIFRNVSYGDEKLIVHPVPK